MTLTKNQVDQLIERLSDKTLSTDLFNLNETERDWLEGFYESSWAVDTMRMTPLEEKLCRRLTSDFLYRHMEVYDWNLPYAEAMILIARQEIKKHLEAKGHPILIGDVLEKLKDDMRFWLSHHYGYEECKDPECEGEYTHEIIRRLWKKCGFTSSLQENAEKIEWEQVCTCNDHLMPGVFGVKACMGCMKRQVAKPSPQTNLFTYLIQTGL